MIQPRYNLYEVVYTCILYNLTQEETESAIFGEVDFDKTTQMQYTLSVAMMELYLGLK